MLTMVVDDESHARADPQFREDVLTGMALRPRAVPARWLYDDRGSELFEQITDLPEYYPTRTETAILREACPQLTAITGTGRAVIELGSGSSTKTPVLLRCVAPSAYVPIDISGEFLRQSAQVLAAAHPDLSVLPVEADFTKPLKLPAAIAKTPKLGFFPGSTIGNFGAARAVDLLRALRVSLGAEENGGAMLLIGIDRLKEGRVLQRAYDDRAGVTAAFNLNLLVRINRELEGTIPLDAFRHRAVWNANLARIEMHLEALRDTAFTIEGCSFAIRRGETIHTENSHKYGERDAKLLLAAGGWTTLADWTDPAGAFGVYLAHAQTVPVAP